MGSREPSSSNSGQILSSSAAIIIASNDDILTQILAFLPPKSLLKFKAVSKHWLSLITDPKFKPKHMINSRTISGLFVRCHLLTKLNAEYEFINLISPNPNPSRPPFRSLTFVEDPNGICILQSCNGLMLCRSFRGNPQEATYYIYNPTTNQYRVLPGMQASNDPYSWFLRNILDVKLAFDPSKSFHNYKVICIYNCDPDLPDHCQVEVYSSKTGSWKSLGSPFVKPVHVLFRNGVFWNGSIHWISIRGRRDSLRFDVEEEQFREIPMPTFRGDSPLIRHFGESGGHLYLMEVTDSETLLYDVYEMELDYSVWFLKYKVDLQPIAAAFPEMIWGSDIYPPYTYNILGIVQEEIDDESFLVLHIQGKAIRYNFKDGSFGMIHDFAPRVRTLDHFSAYQFIESFACV